MDTVERLAHAFERLPGIGPRQAKRFVYHLLAASPSDRTLFAKLIGALNNDVQQCSECYKFWSGSGEMCGYCSDNLRDDGLLMLVEKDQDIIAIERTNGYRGRYFVLGGVLTLSGRGSVRERELIHILELRLKRGLKEIVLALSATSEGEHTTDYVRKILTPYRNRVRITTLGRGLATGNELEYADAQTLSSALMNRKES